MQKTRGTSRLFVDEVVIHVRGGKGGDGCVAFHREKFAPKGGPDGGDGGHGGSVYLVARAELDTLLDLAGHHHWYAENGQPGSGANRHGRRGESLYVNVPVGTLVYDADSGALLRDLTHDGQTLRVARNGRGGRGNEFYKSSTNQAPRQFQPGRPGQERRLRLELKLIAEVGLVGLPNAGKSTLLSRLTNARPKIAAYPFTTTEPQLGIAELPGFRRLVLADIPGLIEGAHEGVGLGDAFLRHIERTRVIAHLIDLAPPEGSPRPLEAYRTIRSELEKYSPALAARREVIIGNKLDLTGAQEALDELRAALGDGVLGTSGVSGAGLRAVLEQLWILVDEEKRAEAQAAPERIELGTPKAPPPAASAEADADEEEYSDEPPQLAPDEPPANPSESSDDTEPTA